jgi:lipoprotein NlpD
MCIFPYKSLGSLLRVVSILSAFCLLFACASDPVGVVSERSSQHGNKAKVHLVSAGETLFSISFRYGVDYKKLAEFNAIKSPYTIFPAQKIRIYKPLLAVRQNGAQANPAVSAPRGAAKIKALPGGRSEKGSRYASKSTGGSVVESAPKWQWPAAGQLIALFQGDSGSNKGIDLGGKLGEPVLAAASGRVVYAGSGLSGYGKLLIIKHNETFLSAYAHNDEISIKEGDFVKAGQRIADMGSSGTDRVKLHFEIRSEGSPVDPLKFLPKR